MAGARGSGHLPKQGGPAAGEPPPELPRQRHGRAPGGRGRYPDYDVLAEVGHWDGKTREVVLARVESTPPVRFFDEAEARTLGAFCDDVLAQEDEPRVPVLAMVDEKLYENRLDGYRYAEMPSDPITWREAAKMLDAAARAAGAEDYAAAAREVRHDLIDRFSEGRLEHPKLDAEKAWKVVMRAVLAAFYSHPWVWNEIGFGGPAYPRGFARLGAGQREHWERSPKFEADPVADVPERGGRFDPGEDDLAG
ncbi:MAG TPA: gluconate 2-dehydrogenase subunit 3 family protein, partial [Solirubrobacterales bacterium]